MTAVNAIRHIYKTAEWSFDENEFLDERATREHSVLLENDLRRMMTGDCGIFQN